MHPYVDNTYLLHTDCSSKYDNINIPSCIKYIDYDYRRVFRNFYKVTNRNCGPQKGLFWVVGGVLCAVRWVYGRRLGAFTANPASQLDVLWHDGDTLRVDGAQVGVLEEAHQVSLARLLESHNGGALETQVGLEVLRYLAN